MVQCDDLARDLCDHRYAIQLARNPLYPRPLCEDQNDRRTIAADANSRAHYARRGEQCIRMGLLGRNSAGQPGRRVRRTGGGDCRDCQKNC